MMVEMLLVLIMLLVTHFSKLYRPQFKIFVFYDMKITSQFTEVTGNEINLCVLILPSLMRRF